MERWQLKQLQQLPLEIKIQKSRQRIIEWYEHFQGNVYISFSGGKDSTVLLHLVRSIYKDVAAVFCDTGLEYPELKEHVKNIENVKWIKPQMNFKNVIETYGYPVISKEISDKIYKFKNYNLSDRFKNYLLNGDERGSIGMIPKRWQFLLKKDIKISSRCCDEMKKKPFKKYEKTTGNKAIIGTMANESNLRTQKYLQNGCNSFETKKQISTPLGFWTEQDILKYIQLHNLKIPSVYGTVYKDNEIYKLTGVQRTGCVFCCYGIHKESYPNRFQKLEKTHKNLYDYCINKLKFKNILELINVEYKNKVLDRSKYKIQTKKISCRISLNKLNNLKTIYNNQSTTKIIDLLIKNEISKIDKRKKYNNNISFFDNNKILDKSKYKIETKKIDCRVNINYLNLLKNHYNLKTNTQVVEKIIENKLQNITFSMVI